MNLKNLKMDQNLKKKKEIRCSRTFEFLGHCGGNNWLVTA
jgi:hypothetical protein